MSHRQSSPRGFFFWSLTPFLTVFVLSMPFLVTNRDIGAVSALVAVETMAILMLLGLFAPSKFHWAWRGVGAGVFLLFLVYLIGMLIRDGFTIALPRRRSETSAFNALCGLVVFGIPGLWFAWTGRLPGWKEPGDDELLGDEFDEFSLDDEQEEPGRTS